MMVKVTQENFNLFLEKKREIVLMNGADHERYEFLSSIPDCDGNYLIAMSMRNRLPQRLYIPHILKEYSNYFYFDSLKDIYQAEIEWHKKQIENLKKRINTETIIAIYEKSI